MKTIINIYTFILVALFLNVPSYAQLEVSAEIRPRGEFRRGYKSLVTEAEKDNPSVVFSQRTRLGVDYKSSIFKARVILQDVRVWGDESLYSSTGVFGDKGSTDLYEAWLQISLYKDFMVKVGRQEWKYDDLRLLSNRNWNQRGITYDGVLLGLRNEKWQVDGGFSWNNEEESLINEPYNPAKIRTLDFIYLKRNFNRGLSASLIALTNGYQKNDTSMVIYLRGTYGANVWYEHDFLRLHGAGYYQNGKNNSGVNVSAYAFIAYAGFKFKNWTFGPGLEWFSGNDRLRNKTGEDKTDHFFDVLYGARHRYYGYMDYFNNMKKATGGSGLIDAYFKIDKTFLDKHNIELSWHYFALENHYQVEELPGQYRNLDPYLASEADLVYTYTMNKWFNMNVGYSIFLPNSTIETINGLSEGSSVTGHWAWVMLTFKPVIFNSDLYVTKK
ncbi:MAG: alginate export family protein [Bacteroidetes bacterium]|nr:alginate export family protein [Bacteroidota bacterium]